MFVISSTLLDDLCKSVCFLTVWVDLEVKHTNEWVVFLHGFHFEVRLNSMEKMESTCVKSRKNINDDKKAFFGFFNTKEMQRAFVAFFIVG